MPAGILRPMLFRRFCYEPLAQNAYVLADGGEAIVVDPRRDVDELLAFVAGERLHVRWVVATHVHADFVAGLGEVAAATGAPVALGEAFTGRHPCRRLGDGEQLTFGGRTVRVLATPGHTIESVSLFVAPEPGGAPLLLSGDTLFVGDVGRPDLAQGMGMSPRSMAERLFATLRDRIAALPDATEVWPAHGAGSACGTCIDAAPSSTLGVERSTNWALLETDADRFCDRLLRAQRKPPRVFAEVAALNAVGAPLLRTLPAVAPLPPADVARAIAGGTVLLDVRSAARYAAGHWPGSYNLGAHGSSFEAAIGNLLSIRTPLVLHAEGPDDAALAVQRLRRLGFDDVRGFVTTPPPAPATLPQIDAVDLAEPGARDRWQMVDVRRPDEYARGHVPGAVHCELTAELAHAALARLDRARRTAILCETGYRSSTASRLLRDAGFTDLHNVRDGTRGWRDNHLPLETAGITATS